MADHEHNYSDPTDPADPARYADGCPRYWWHELTAEEHAEFFCYFTAEQAVAAMAYQARKYGIPDKITDPEIVARMAKILMEPERPAWHEGDHGEDTSA